MHAEHPAQSVSLNSSEPSLSFFSMLCSFIITFSDAAFLPCRMYKSGDRLSPEDEVKVRSVFQYHPKAEEKAGPGIDYVKVNFASI